jgi:hypothetical protein
MEDEGTGYKRCSISAKFEAGVENDGIFQDHHHKNNYLDWTGNHCIVYSR